MPDAVIITIISSGTTLAGVIFTAFMVYFTSRKVEKVHILVNSRMTAQLRLTAVALRRLAISSGNEDDYTTADAADRLCEEQERKQDGK